MRRIFILIFSAFILFNSSVQVLAAEEANLLEEELEEEEDDEMELEDFYPTDFDEESDEEVDVDPDSNLFSDSDILKVKVKKDKEIKKILLDRDKSNVSDIRVAELIIAELLKMKKYKGKVHKIELKEVYPDGGSNYVYKNLVLKKGKVKIPLQPNYDVYGSSGDIYSIEISYKDKERVNDIFREESAQADTSKSSMLEDMERMQEEEVNNKKNDSNKNKTKEKKGKKKSKSKKKKKAKLDYDLTKLAPKVNTDLKDNEGKEEKTEEAEVTDNDLNQPTLNEQTEPITEEFVGLAEPASNEFKFPIKLVLGVVGGIIIFILVITILVKSKKKRQ